MVQLLAISSLAEAERVYGLVESPDTAFFSEWTEALEDLTAPNLERLDLIKSRYLYHRQHGHLLKNAVNFLVISPILEMAGFYDPPFLLRSEVSVQFEFEDENQKVYQGRIDVLVVQQTLWVVLVEAKRTSFNMTTALPQALAYMASSCQQGATFALVSNGEHSIFVKLAGEYYGFSDEFSLNRRRNELVNVLQILNRLKTEVD
jgi:predicted type IV restriction endonuclease